MITATSVCLRAGVLATHLFGSVGYANAEKAGTGSANHSNDQRSGETRRPGAIRCRVRPPAPRDEVCLDLQRGGRLDGNPLQAYSTTDECTAALQVALAVVHHR